MKRPLVALAAVALLTVITGCSAAEPVVGSDSETRGFEFDGDSLTIDSHNGSLRVTASDVEEVQVRRELTGSVLIGSDSADWSLSGDRLNLERRCTGILSYCRTAYEVVIPRNVALEVSGRNGTIQVAQVDDGVDVTTRNGRVEIEQVTGGVTVETHNGHVAMNYIEGRVEATTRNGSIDVRQTRADVVRLDTHNGKVDARLMAEPRDVNVKTRNGSVDLRLPGGPYAMEVATHNGKQAVEVPTDHSSDQRVRVETHNGAVTIGN